MGTLDPVSRPRPPHPPRPPVDANAYRNELQHLSQLFGCTIMKIGHGADEYYCVYNTLDLLNLRCKPRRLSRYSILQDFIDACVALCQERS